MPRPRHEVLLLALVAVVALSPLQSTSVQDGSHFCLSRALLHARLTVDDCRGLATDRSRYGGHLYSNKAPGMSLLAVPVVLATRLPSPAEWHPPRDARLWLTRVFVSGLPFLLAVFLVGRSAELVRRGTGGLAGVVFGLGTLMAPFAVVGFDHALTAAAGFAAFVLAWRRRPLAAGFLGGLTFLCEYEAAVVLLAVGIYAALRGGRAFGRYLLGALPGVALLALYNWAAFGAPWHNPLTYSDNAYRADHARGFLGVHAPSAHAARLVFFGDKGLLVTSPVLLAAAAGLVLLWRSDRRREAAVCGAVTTVLLLAECGYFDPYGGDSPGPRYLVAALPFLAFGLGPAIARWRAATVALAVPSVLACVLLELSWTRDPHYAATFWGDVVHVLQERSSAELVRKLCDTMFAWAGTGRVTGAAIVLALAFTALGLSARKTV